MEDINIWLREHVRFVFSPFKELVLSLHVLNQPAHHLDHLEWAEKTLSQMSKSMKNDFQQISEGCDAWIAVLDLIDLEQLGSEQPEEIINRLECLPNEFFKRVILGNKIYSPLSELSFFEREAQLKPQAAKERFCHFLYDYQQLFFARELFRITPFLQKAAEELREKFSSNPYETVNQIHPRLTVDMKQIKFFKAQTYAYDISSVHSFTIFPSTYAVPHLWVGVDLPDLTAVYHVSISNQKQTSHMVPADLIAIFKAFSDKSRLLILRLVLNFPMSTVEISEELGLANATVSKHLKILESTGLIEAERRGYFVYYKAKPERIQMLRVDIDQFFDTANLRN